MPANAGNTVQKILLYMAVEKQWVLFMHICDINPTAQKKNILWTTQDNRSCYEMG